jgi:lipopolysaccharide transport system permease protein
MNATSQPKQPLAVFASFWNHRTLILNLARRDVVGRYSGSMLGLLWSFFNPLLMLGVYTFVFGLVFKTRWNPGG